MTVTVMSTYVAARAAMFSPAKPEMLTAKAIHSPTPVDRYGQGYLEHEYVDSRSEEIATARMSNDEDLASALCDALTAGNLSSDSALTRRLGERTKQILAAFRASDFVAFAELLADAAATDVLESALSTAEDEWHQPFSSIPKTARAA